MTTETFEKIFNDQVNRCESILITKAKEYAGGGDRLHNFKRAAGLTGELPRAALAGMMLKHTVSIYDMCNSEEDFSAAMWDEKITDSLNYLFLLKALVEDEKAQSVSCRSVD